MNKVKLRKKLLIKGDLYSLYLDIYPAIIDTKTGKKSRRIFLGSYIYTNPKNKEEKELNDTVIMQAEKDRAICEISLFNKQHNLHDRHLGRLSFTDFFEKECKLRSNLQWVSAYKHFKNYIGDVKFIAINQDIVNGYRNYLLNANQLKNLKTQKKIGKAAASSYFNIFVALIKKARKERFITETFEYEFIKVPQGKREFLNPYELIELANTPCEIEVLKRSALFSCLTGLRFSDIKSLKWSDIDYMDIDKPFITKMQDKTDNLVSSPISKVALDLCGNKTDYNDYIFKNLERKHLYAPLQKWLSQTTIKKKITFHKFRHTYANFLMNNKLDIYGIQQLLGHKSINTTQIYLNMNNERFRPEVEMIKLK